MRKKAHFLVFFSFVLVVIFTACEESTFLKGNVSERETYLYLNYVNPDTSETNNTELKDRGDAPEISLIPDSSSSSIKIDFSSPFKGKILTVDGEESRVKIVIDNMRIADQYGNFQITDVRPEEYKAGRLQPQSVYETPIEYNAVQELEVVMVLDASASMRPNMGRLKSAAKDFVRKIDKEVNPRFSIVSFSESIDSLQFTGKVDEATNYIDNLTASGTSTPLYRAMLKAIGILEKTDATSKTLLTFTDGRDNTDTYKPDTVISRLTSRTDDPVKIQSYVIGFEGEANVDKEILDDFGVRGTSLYPKDKEELEKFFNYFSKVVSTVYSLTYERNNTAIPEDNPRRIRFRFSTKQQ